MFSALVSTLSLTGELSPPATARAIEQGWFNPRVITKTNTCGITEPSQAVETMLEG